MRTLMLVTAAAMAAAFAADVSRWSGRCVEDLGYGRYEACGW